MDRMLPWTAARSLFGRRRSVQGKEAMESMTSCSSQLFSSVASRSRSRRILRDGQEPIGDLGAQKGVRLLVTTLSSDHEIGIHRLFRTRVSVQADALTTVWAGLARWNFNLRQIEADREVTPAPDPSGAGPRLRDQRDADGSIWIESTTLRSAATSSAEVSGKYTASKTRRSPSTSMM